ATFSSGLDGYDYQVNLLNGVPASVVFLPTPYTFGDYLYKTTAYAQDQWSARNFTLNMGLRFDRLKTTYHDYTIAATRLLPERSFPGATVLTWTDLSPRLGISYDLSGKGTTAIKASISRYVLQEALDLTRVVDPTTAS